MDTASKNLYARVFGSLALAALLMHVGQHLMDEFGDARVPPLAWLAVSGFFVVAVAGAWAQARLNAKRAALWTALATNAALPAGAFLFHRAPLDANGGYGIVLLLALVFGLAAAVFTGMRLAEK